MSGMSLHPDFVSELGKHFDGEVRLDLASRILYSTDASLYQVEPLGVALPRTQEDLQAVVELAARYGIPLLPRGSGTSLGGQAVGQALIVDCTRWLDNILEIDPEGKTATVEPGVILQALNREAGRYGLAFGPDPASAERATLGGVIGNNATGAHSIRYGMTADHLLSAGVVLADGSLSELREISLDAARQKAAGEHLLEASLYSAALHIRQQADIANDWPPFWRNSAGYRLNYLLPVSQSCPPQWESGAPYPPLAKDHINLAHLLAGSEGTLAVIRQATLRLVPKPRYTALAVLSYDSLEAACEAVPGLLEYGPSAVELIPKMLVDLARGVPAYSRQLGWVPGNPQALLAVEFSGSQPAAVEQAARALGSEAMLAVSPSAQADVWAVRKVGMGILNSNPTELRPTAFIEDCAVPVENLGEFVRSMQLILEAHGTRAAFYAHASAGCLHIRPLVNLKTGSGVGQLRSISEAALELVLRLGGTMTSEHGDGLVRSEWLRRTYGDELLSYFRLLKQAADPQGILNPGKIVDPPPMDTSLRYGAGYRAQPWTASLAFHKSRGLETAVDQCNGAGVCRKQEGVMCPSFQATREEMHSTRGRANLLRALISGHWKEAVTGSDGKGGLQKLVFQSLDQCLACKGCLSECPSGVDIARLKYEFQHEYYKTHHRRPRDYLFGYINQLAVWVGRLRIGGLVNQLMGLKLVQGLLDHCLGVSAQRSFPMFRGPDRRLRQTSIEDQQSEIVLYLPDAFSRFFEPEVEAAALDLLRACNVEVVVLPVLGAGRTLLSKGFLDSARRQAVRVLEAVRRLDPQGRLPVVGAEPSEIYTLRDEFLDLLPDQREVIEALAKRTWMLDEFLVRPGPGGAVRIAALQSTDNYPRSKVLLHGHCYQKAQPQADDGFPVGQDASADLLRQLGCQVEVVDSGCCGMAGAFGYEKEHYELSMKVGELTLLPKIREWCAGNCQGKVVAAGTSCRSQIADGTGNQALHPLVLAVNSLSKRC